jgi:DNA-binding transcriptional MerR regulator
VSKLCDLKPHVLRYWEQEFSQLQSVTRRGNRRYYQQEEVLLIRKIRQLLYFEGFTIQGAKSKLSDRQFVKETTSKVEIEKAQAELPLSEEVQTKNTPENLNNLKTQLHEILKILK